MRLCYRGHGYYKGLRCPGCLRIKQQAMNADPKRTAYRHPAYRSQPKHGLCHICRRPGADTRDHINPIEQQMRRWGEVRDHRTLPAHRSCNSARGAAL
jgi:5-methylcytosine-specific restriction endonuclease McrA